MCIELRILMLHIIQFTCESSATPVCTSHEAWRHVARHRQKEATWLRVGAHAASSQASSAQPPVTRSRRVWWRWTLCCCCSVIRLQKKRVSSRKPTPCTTAALHRGRNT